MGSPADAIIAVCHRRREEELARLLDLLSMSGRDQLLPPAESVVEISAHPEEAQLVSLLIWPRSGAGRVAGAMKDLLMSTTAHAILSEGVRQVLAQS